MADFDGATDVFDLSGNGKGVALNVYGSPPAEIGGIIDVKKQFSFFCNAIGDDTQAMYNWAAYTVLFPDAEYHFPAMSKVRIATQTSTFVFGPAAVRMNGTRFFYESTLVGSTPAFQLPAGSDWDSFLVKFTGGSFRRFLMLQGQVGDRASAYIKKVRAWSAIPRGSASDGSDAFLRYYVGDLVPEWQITGDAAAPAFTYWADARVDDFETYNIQFPFNSRISPNIGYGGSFGRYKVRGYVCGMKWITHIGGSVEKFDIQLQTTDAATNPGHNGILTAGVQNMSMGSGLVADAGEHNIRMGGGLDAAQLVTKNVTWGDISSLRAGQCGFKAWSNYEWIYNVTVNSLLVTDCAYNNVIGTNEDALRIEQCRTFTVNSLTVRAVDRPNSCMDLIYITGSEDVFVHVNGSGALRNGVRIERLNASPAPGGNITPQTNKNITVTGQVRDCGEQAVYIDAKTLLTSAGATDSATHQTTEDIDIRLKIIRCKGIYWDAVSQVGGFIGGSSRSITGTLMTLNGLTPVQDHVIH